MLELMIFLLVVIITLPKECPWYESIWGLCGGGLFSMVHLFTTSDGYFMGNHYISMDSLSSALVSLTLWIAAMIFIASHNTVKFPHNNCDRFILSSFILSYILVVSFCCSNAVSFYVMFEASLIPTFILILGWGYQPERLQSISYMMLYTVSASLPLLVMILWGLEEFSSTSMLSISMIRKVVSFGNIDWVTGISFLLIFSAFLVKLPVFSLHLWLPKAHVEAPVAGSMVLAAILLKLGGYGVARLFLFFGFNICSMLVFVFALALWGGVVTSVICFRQVDVKSLIAYSSIGHMALMLAGIISNSTWGWNGALTMMIAHGFTSSALFALANYTYEKLQTRNLFLCKGMLMIIPFLSFWCFMFCATNMAAPPSINLVGEVMTYPCVIFSSKYYIFSMALMSFFSGLYSLYLYTCTQHGSSPKFMSSFNCLKSGAYVLFFLHLIPCNFLMLKSDLVMMSL